MFNEKMVSFPLAAPETDRRNHQAIIAGRKNYYAVLEHYNTFKQEEMLQVLQTLKMVEELYRTNQLIRQTENESSPYFDLLEV